MPAKTKSSRKIKAVSYEKLTSGWDKPRAKKLRITIGATDTSVSPFDAEKSVVDTAKDGTYRAKQRRWYLEMKDPDSKEWNRLFHVIYWITCSREKGDPRGVYFLGPPENAARQAIPIIDEIIRQKPDVATQLEFRLMPVDTEVVEYSKGVELEWRYGRMMII